MDRFDDDDSEYMEVKTIYESRRERLRSERTSQLRRIIRERLLDAGVTEFPVLYLIMKSAMGSPGVGLAAHGAAVRGGD